MKPTIQVEHKFGISKPHIELFYNWQIIYKRYIKYLLPNYRNLIMGLLETFSNEAIKHKHHLLDPHARTKLQVYRRHGLSTYDTS